MFQRDAIDIFCDLERFPLLWLPPQYVMRIKAFEPTAASNKTSRRYGCYQNMNLSKHVAGSCVPGQHASAK